VRENGSWGFEEGDEIAAGRHATRLLGGGRRYEAYLSWDDELHALVVVKVVRPGLVESGAGLPGLAGEARALASLNHPSIVRMFDAVLDGERPHLVLEYLDGPRLSTLIRRFGVIVEQLLPLALEVCSALHYMHGREFVHLDVKPRNLVMSARPRLIDLRIATPFSDLGEITRPIGTDAYMAPEQCDPDRLQEIGTASDMWGLGVALYESLARALPFAPPDSSGPTAAARYPQIDSDPAPLPRGVPPELADLILACLERRPADRPSAVELSGELEPWIARLPGPRLGLFRPGGRTHRSDYAPRDESILSGISSQAHRARVLLSAMSRQREGGAR
jgi:serine/threonine protein kinase